MDYSELNLLCYVLVSQTMYAGLTFIVHIFIFYNQLNIKEQNI